MKGRGCPPEARRARSASGASTAREGALADGATAAAAAIHAVAGDVTPAACSLLDSPGVAARRAVGGDAVTGDVSGLQGAHAVGVDRQAVRGGARAGAGAAVPAGHRGTAGLFVLDDGGKAHLTRPGRLRRAGSAGQRLSQDGSQNLVRDRTRARRIGESSDRNQEEATGENPRLLHRLLLLCEFDHPIRVVLHKRDGEPSALNDLQHSPGVLLQHEGNLQHFAFPGVPPPERGSGLGVRRARSEDFAANARHFAAKLLTLAARFGNFAANQG